MLDVSIRVPACLAVHLLVLSVCHADIIAQHIYTDDVDATFNSGAGMASDDGIIYDNRYAQSFLTVETGQVGAVSFVASVLAPTAADLRLSLMSFSLGQPGSVLGSVLVGADTFATGFLSFSYEFTHTVDFTSQDITLQSGLQYALVFSTDMPDANYRIYGDYEGYTGGATLFSQNGSPFSQRPGDFYFRIAAVPAPAAGMILGFAALACFPRRRS